jgi:rRNA maturation endonuclease Nob1
MTLGFAAFLLGALGGLGFPEMLVLALVIMVTVFLFRGASGRKGPTRFCTGCGRGLTQPADAPFCCYCGKRLP